MPSRPKKPTKLAIFDIDGTIFRSSLAIELINQLVANGTFPARAKKEMETDYLAWLDRRGSYEDYLRQVIKIFFKYIPGVRKTDFDRAVRKVIPFHKDRVYRYTRDLIRDLRRRGYFLLTISGSPDGIVTPFAASLGFNTSFGRTFKMKRGRFTGITLNHELLDKRKDKIVLQFIKDRGLKVDLKNSIAVGDTETDIPLLKLVGKPIAFNPNNSLARTAKRHGWAIIVERKDVIYELKKFNFKF